MNYQGQRKIEKTGREGVVGEEETQGPLLGQGFYPRRLGRA